MRTTSGACVRRARLAAADGMPMPTKHTVPFFRRRAASIVMISVGVYWTLTPSGIGFPCGLDPGLRRGDTFARRRDAGRLHELRVALRSHHVLLHPREERVALLRDA